LIRCHAAALLIKSSVILPLPWVYNGVFPFDLKFVNAKNYLPELKLKYGSMLISVGNENSIKFVLSWLILFAQQYGII